MSEKVLFEFRAEENEDGYTIFVKHDKEAFPAWCPSIGGRFFPFFKEDVVKRLHKYRKFSKRRMRRRLDLYERMYEDLYGPIEEGEE
jgi:hypothetical protein